MSRDRATLNLNARAHSQHGWSRVRLRSRRSETRLKPILRPSQTRCRRETLQTRQTEPTPRRKKQNCVGLTGHQLGLRPSFGQAAPSRRVRQHRSAPAGAAARSLTASTSWLQGNWTRCARARASAGWAGEWIRNMRPAPQRRRAGLVLLAGQARGTGRHGAGEPGSAVMGRDTQALFAPSDGRCARASARGCVRHDHGAAAALGSAGWRRLTPVCGLRDVRRGLHPPGRRLARPDDSVDPAASSGCISVTHQQVREHPASCQEDKPIQPGLLKPAMKTPQSHFQLQSIDTYVLPAEQ